MGLARHRRHRGFCSEAEPMILADRVGGWCVESVESYFSALGGVCVHGSSFLLSSHAKRLGSAQNLDHF